VASYEDLARRAIEARGRAEALQRDARRIGDLARALQAAHREGAILVRCAWCDRLRIGEEWLHLEAIGRGQQLITSTIRDNASHGICPTCLAHELERTQEQRRNRGRGGAR
jgi:hypothetical protein